MTVHKGVDLFPCKVCGKKFGNQENARRHKKAVHNETKSDEESLMEKNVIKSKLSNLEKFLNIIPNCETEKEDLKCEECSLKFITEKGLQLHLEFKHNKKEIDKELC